MRRPAKPATPKNPTPEQLRAWFKELKKYEAALQKWDDLLTNREANLEDQLDELSEVCDDEIWFCNVCEVEHVGPVDTYLNCYAEWSRRRNRGEWTPEINGNPCAEIAIETVQGNKAEIDWLEKLYALPDRRKKKAVKCEHGIEEYNNIRDIWVCKKCGHERKRK